jgi:chromosome segregation ATPase
MAVNIFGEGKQSQGGPGQKGAPGVGFKLLDNDGNYDIDSKRLANVATPESGNDAVTLAYTNALYSDVFASMSDLDSKLKGVEEGFDVFDTLREDVYGRLEDVESSVDEVAKVSDEVKEGLEEYKVSSDERHASLNALVHSDRQEALDRIALSERMMDARRTELSRDTAKVVDLCNDLEKKIATSEASIETMNSAITALLVELRSVGSVLSIATGDVTINTSEIEHIKVMVERLKEKKADRGGDESLSSALSVIGDKMSTLEASLSEVSGKLSWLDIRVNNIVKANVRNAMINAPSLRLMGDSPQPGPRYDLDDDL